MQIYKAQKLANRIVEILNPSCTITNIAGSVRRQKPEVKDIEIVCLPKKVSTDLFGQGEFKTVPEFREAVNKIAASVIKGNADGRYMQIQLKGDFDLKLDLFMPEPDDYFRQYAIRTGSAEYSAKVIAASWVAKGWCGSDKGLRKQSDCLAITNSEGKAVGWRCVIQNAEKPPVWQSEEEFFEWIGVKWPEPEKRSI